MNGDLPHAVIDRRRAFAERCIALASQTSSAHVGEIRQALRYPATAAESLNQPSDASRQRIQHTTLIVSGLLGDSVRALVAPMMCARDWLDDAGYDIEVAWLNGRSGCSHNAVKLRERVLAVSERTGKPVSVIGYSKGCADALHMLAEHPETHAAVHALVSYAGVVHGSPLAARTPDWLERVLQYAPLPGLGRGDGRVIDDLEPAFRRRWLQEHPLPTGIRYCSLSALPQPHNVSRVLRGSWRKLSHIDPANDSQMIASDVLLPGSEWLAEVDADHWAIALPLERDRRWLVSLIGKWLVTENDYPRRIVLQALIDYLNETPAEMI